MKKIIKLTESDLTRIVKRIIQENQSKIDDILDKISRDGYEKLTPKEKQYLKHYSETGEYPDDDLTTRKSMEDYKGEPFTFGDKVRDTLGSFVGIPKTPDSLKVLAHKILYKVENGEYEKVENTDGFYGRGKTIKVNLEDGEYIVSPRKERVALTNSFITSTMIKNPNGDRFMIPGKGFARKLMELIG
jgi:hypothetical protein